MSVPISGICVVVRKEKLEQRAESAFSQLVSAAHATEVLSDDVLLAVTFANEQDRDAFLGSILSAGMSSDDFAAFSADGSSTPAAPWLEIERSQEASHVWLRSSGRGAPASTPDHPRAPYQRHETLSRSESGLHFVRERKSGFLRQLTEEELQDFSDPPPCVDCGEQFGCNHRNCAGEVLLDDDEMAGAVPPQWAAFARDEGISWKDLERLRSIERSEGEYRLVAESDSDMRTMELMLLLNEAR